MAPQAIFFIWLKMATFDALKALKIRQNREKFQNPIISSAWQFQNSIISSA